MDRSDCRPTACAQLPFFSPSPSEVISKPILNGAFEKQDHCSVFLPFKGLLFCFSRREEVEQAV